MGDGVKPGDPEARSDRRTNLPADGIESDPPWAGRAPVPSGRHSWGNSNWEISNKETGHRPGHLQASSHQGGGCGAGVGRGPAPTTKSGELSHATHVSAQWLLCGPVGHPQGRSGGVPHIYRREETLAFTLQQPLPTAAPRALAQVRSTLTPHRMTGALVATSHKDNSSFVLASRGGTSTDGGAGG